jgi:hypothetical protein
MPTPRPSRPRPKPAAVANARRASAAARRREEAAAIEKAKADLALVEPDTSPSTDPPRIVLDDLTVQYIEASLSIIRVGANDPNFDAWSQLIHHVRQVVLVYRAPPTP